MDMSQSVASVASIVDVMRSNLTNSRQNQEMEIRVVEFLVHNWESKLKDFFLADLSWTNNQEERNRAFVDFFTKRKGKRVLDILPEDIRNYILANSL